MHLNQKKHKYSAPLVGNPAPSTHKPQLLNTITTQPPKNQLRTSTEPTKDEQHWQFMQNRRESHLNALFNRRKTMLESISRKNRKIYQRIQNQQSHYHKIHLQKPTDKQHIQTLTNGSRVLLALSRNALTMSRTPAQSQIQTVEYDKNNQQNIYKRPQKCSQSQGFKHFSRKDEPLATISQQYQKPKEIQSRIIETFRTRLQQNKSQQLQYPKIRAHSVGRKRLQDVFINF